VVGASFNCTSPAHLSDQNREDKAAPTTLIIHCVVCWWLKQGTSSILLEGAYLIGKEKQSKGGLRGKEKEGGERGKERRLPRLQLELLVFTGIALFPFFLSSFPSIV